MTYLKMFISMLKQDFLNLQKYFSMKYWVTSWFTIFWILILLFYPKFIVIVILYMFYKYIMKYFFLLLDIFFCDLFELKKNKFNWIYFFFSNKFNWILYMLPCEMLMPFILSIFKQKTWMKILEFVVSKIFNGMLKILFFIITFISWIVQFFLWLEYIDEHIKEMLRYWNDFLQNRRLKNYIKQQIKEEEKQKKSELRRERLKKLNAKKELFFSLFKFLKEYGEYLFSIIFIPFEWIFEIILRKVWYPMVMNIKASYWMFLFWKQNKMISKIFMYYFKYLYFLFGWLSGKYILILKIKMYFPFLFQVKLFPFRFLYYFRLWKNKILFFHMKLFIFLCKIIDKMCDFWPWLRILGSYFFYFFSWFFKLCKIMKIKMVKFYNWLKNKMLNFFMKK